MTTPPVTARPYPHPRVNAAWLAQRSEAPLEPALPIVDAHHHLWDRAGEEYLLPAFLADTATGHNVRASVFVQCGFGYDVDGPSELRPVGETRRVAAMVAEHEARTGRRVAACQGIVGHVDMRLGDAARGVLERHLEAGQGRFRGIRHSASWDPAIVTTMVSGTPPPGMLGDASFRRGMATLSPLQLSFDAWIYHPQLPELHDLARQFPDVPIALGHVGGVLGIGPYAENPAQTFADWRAGMAQLAQCPNVHVKLGGLARPVAGFNFHESPQPWSSADMAQAWRPYIETSIELFGPQRCMFESNFPVDKGLCSYGLLWNAFKRLAAGCSADEKHALFAGTATSFYRLDIAD
ncbi:MAG: amidohydrolase family protein [Casimicrobiaceae bacterium]